MSQLIDQAEQYAIDFLTNGLDKQFVYHNIAHTQRVVEK